MTTPQLTTLRAAVIGVGAMGQHHVRVYRELAGIDLVGVADSNDNIRVTLEQRYQVKSYANYLELLEAAQPQIVTIAVPTALHLEVATQAIRRGVHVLIEKPIAETEHDALTLINLAREQGITLAIGHIERHNPAIRALKGYLENGQLGRIFEIRAERVGPFPARIRDVGVVLDLATHDIDIVRHLAGSPLMRVYAETQQNIHTSREDTLSGLMRFENGITGILQINWLTPTKSRKLRVTGAAGMYEVDYITQDLTFYENGQAMLGYDNLLMLRGVSEGRVIREQVEKREPLRAEIEDFIQAVRTGYPPHVTGEDSLNAVRVAHALVQSGQLHQTVEIKL